MISIFILLLLSHALADFVFQSGRLYQWKVKSVWGIVVHVLIFGAIAKLLTWPMVITYPLFWVWLALAVVAHFIIDKVKLVTKSSTIIDEIKAFTYDQIAHITVLMTVFLLPISFPELSFRKVSWIGKLIERFPFLGPWPQLMLALIIIFLGIYAAYALAVILYYYDRTVNPAIKRLHYTVGGMLYRLTIFGLLISSYRSVVLVIMAIHWLRDRRRLVYDQRRFLIEYALLFGLWFIFEGMKRSLL